MAKRTSEEPPWKRANPAKASGQSAPLTQAQKAEARERAREAGRPYPNLVDNMAVEAPIKEAMIASADRIVLLATETKFPGTGALRLCTLSEVDTVVTTAGANPTTLDLCRHAGGEVIIA